MVQTVLFLVMIHPFHAWITTRQCREIHWQRLERHTANRQWLSVPLPEIRWTVPNRKRGWQDETGTWWDEDGIRQGPPQNYWRQRLDERAHEQDMALIKNVLQQGTSISLPVSQVANPLTSPKLLGVWAPMIRNGHRVGSCANERTLKVPYTLSITRAGHRKLGPTTALGTFDAPLKPGERLKVTVITANTESTLPISFQAMGKNDASCTQYLGLVLDEDTLKIGNISYLSDYLLVMRSKDAPMHELWVRAEPIQAVSEEEVSRLRQAEAETAELPKESELVNV
jgi:hypothetical protein